MTTDTASPAIDYEGKGVKVTISAEARTLLEAFGYTFPMKDGKLFWDLRGSIVGLDVDDHDEHDSLVLFMKKIDTDEGPRVFLCRTYSLRLTGNRVHEHYLMCSDRPDAEPFKGLHRNDERAVRNCPIIEG